MSSILFIEKKLRTDKLGFLYLSRVLKDAGHTVDLIQDDIDNAEEYLNNNQVDFVMYSVMTGGHKWYVKRNREIKKEHSIISVMGGPHFTFYPEDGLSDPYIDYVVLGPGENVIVDIVEGKIKEKKVMGHIPENINTIPSPDRSILYKYDEFGKAGIKRFIAGRECPNNCIYCFNHLYHRLYRKERKKFYQITSPDKIIQEIKDVKKKYPLKLVYFNDDDLCRDHDWILEFCKKNKAEIGLPFCGSIRANNATNEILNVMADSGCSFLNIAIESANPDTQKFLNRHDITNQHIISACNTCKELGIKVRLQNMIGIPVENPLEDALLTLEFNLKINPTDSWASITQPFPHTDLWKYCIKKGLINKDSQCTKFYEDSILDILDVEKINRLHKWWFFIVKYQLPMELVNFLLEIPLTKEQKSKMQNLRWEIARDLLYKN